MLLGAELVEVEEMLLRVLLLLDALAEADESGARLPAFGLPLGFDPGLRLTNFREASWLLNTFSALSLEDVDGRTANVEEEVADEDPDALAEMPALAGMAAGEGAPKEPVATVRMVAAKIEANRILDELAGRNKG